MGFTNALKSAGSMGKMNIITTGIGKNGFDWKDKYNIWSGIIGGFFLALSYFGTDQSQVGRYLTAKNERESKIGLLVNGLVKVPMQFLILIVGVLVFSFYQYHKAPIYFDEVKVVAAKKTVYKDSLQIIENNFALATAANDYTAATLYRSAYKQILKKALPGDDANDTNFIFLRFVIDNLPKGLVGLLIAVIFLAAWGSIAAALNSLASCTVIDFHKQFINTNCTDEKDYSIAKWYTFGWGIFSVIVAMFAHNIGNSLIEAVNILGSLFYGVILGIFLVAFWIKSVKGNAVFIAAITTELLVMLIFALDVVSFLWLNVIGALLLLILSVVIQSFLPKKNAINL
jgi:Na+/proline symporter